MRKQSVIEDETLSGSYKSLMKDTKIVDLERITFKGNK